MGGITALNCRTKKGEYIGDRPSVWEHSPFMMLLVNYCRLHAQNVNEPCNMPHKISHILKITFTYSIRPTSVVTADESASQRGDAVTVAVKLIHREDLERQQRAGTHTTTKQLDTLWTEYEADERTARSLLGAGCRLICPRISMSDMVE